MLAHETIRLQVDIANKVADELECGFVYVFDKSNYFLTGTTKVTARGYRYTIRNDNVAVLSAAAQAVLPYDDTNVYTQLARRHFESDHIGLYIARRPAR